MFKLLNNVEVYSPVYQGTKDILICGEKIVKIGTGITYLDAKIIDKKGYYAIPGIIDQHIHITGGGGEGGFSTKTKEVRLTDLINGGVTSVVGLLGTDSLTQNIERLVAKTKALRQEGITAYCLTGAYTYPSPTLTGNVSKDIAFIDEILGVKLALSCHREPFITKDELKRLAHNVRVASMIANKAGFITLHMGDGANGLEIIFDLLQETSLPITLFRPTHVTRTKKLFTDSLKFLNMGGYIDLTVGSKFDKLITSIAKINKEHYQSVTFSSDGNGSFSKYDEFGNLLKIGVQSCETVLKSIQFLIKNGYSIEESIQFSSSNVSKALKLTNKGVIEVGKDADILLLDKDFELDTVIALGKILKTDKNNLVKETFED